ncbi:transposase [Caulobacter sp. DWP3-1-3b2]|uniref:transposase n=1 Tax=Caulobacter sp. DWP3-1-3b2 TaxID=2804643 RepID=UPI003CF562C6
MPRTARVVIPGTPHHVTQRGNRRQPTFLCAADYKTYLQLAAEAFKAAEVEVWAYCLMPNHVHLIATPSTDEGLAEAIAMTHVRYTRHINRREGWKGYLWQGRFASFPMDETYLRLCARYVGLNPVRAGLTRRAIDWPWSSVRAHLTGHADVLLAPAPLSRLPGDDMATFFDDDISADARVALQVATRLGRPLKARAEI